MFKFRLAKTHCRLLNTDSPIHPSLKANQHEYYKLIYCLTRSAIHVLRGCSTAVEHMPRNLEVVGLNPARCWAYFLLFFSFLLSLPTYLHKWSDLNQVPQGGATLTVCIERKIEKNGCLSELPGAKQAQIGYLHFSFSQQPVTVDTGQRL